MAASMGPRREQSTLAPAEQTVYSWPNLLQGVAEATNQLLTSHDNATGINSALATLGRVTGVDRVYIFQVHSHLETDEPAASQLFEWARETVTAEINNPHLQNMAFETYGLGRWYDFLSAGKSISGLIQNLPEVERQILADQDILSILIVPIPVNGKLWGFIGFDDCHSERQWSRDEEAALMTMAATLGGAIANRQTEAELRQERDFIAAVLDTAGALVIVLDREGRIVRFNRACEQTTDYSFEEVKDQYFWDLFLIPEELESVKAIFKQLTAGQFPNKYENFWVCKDGSRRRIAWSSTALLDAHGNIKYVIGTGIDMSDRYSVQEELRKSEELYRTLARNFPNGGVFLFDRDLRYTIAEGAGLAAIGLSQQLLAGKTIWEVLPPEICQQLEPHYRAALAGEANTFELPYGNFIYLLHTLPVKNEQGEIFAGMVMSQDITERKRTEMALRQSESRLRQYNKVLMELAKRKTLNSGSLNAAIQEITEAAARTLEVERASVWLYNQNRSKIYCIDLYERSANRHSQGLELAAVHYPSYFKALEAERTIAVDDAHNDLRTQEFSETYLTAFDLKSMLDAPIWLGGQMVGVVCHEHVKSNRHWTLEEQNFAGSVADLVSLAIEAYERKRAQQELQEREKQYRAIFEATSDGLIINDLNGRVVEANPAACLMHGYTYKELIGLNLDILVHPDYDRVLEAFIAKLKEGEQFEGEAIALRKDGTPFPIEVRGTPFTYKGKPHLLGVARDITERKRSEAALRESEEKFSKAFCSSPSAISITRLSDGRIVEVNDSFLSISGYDRQEVIGKTTVEMNMWADVADRIKTVRALQEQGSIRNQETVFRKKSGELFVGLFSAEMINFAGESCLLSVTYDITDRKRAEAALRESEEKFSKAFRSSPSAIGIATFPEGCIIEVNDSFLEVTGYDREEIIGRTTQELNLWEKLEDRALALKSLQERGAIRNQEFLFRRKSGELIVGLFSAELVNLGGRQCLLTATNDITERKRAEAALRESEEKFRSAFRSSPDPIVINTLPESRLIEVNDSFLEATGYDREEVIGRTITELNIWVNSDARALAREILQQQGAIRNFEFEFRKKSGELGVALFSAETINLADEQSLLAVIHDITERKRAEEQLRAAAERDRLLAQIALRIRRSLNLDQILKTTVAEVRQFFQADRVFIGHANSNGQGQIIVESVDPHYPSILGWIVEDRDYLGKMQDLLARDRVHAIDDTTQVPVDACIGKYMSQYQVRAGLIVPIWAGDQLFGALAVHQCSGPRHWQPFEIDLLEQLATQVAIAIQQAQLYQQVQDLNEGLERQVEERTQELQQKMQELQELNQLKDLFLHAVTHDLRTPVMGWLLVLKNLLNQLPAATQEASPSSIPVSRSILERMIQSSDRQLYLINSLLEVHSSEVRGVVLHREPVELSQLVQALVADLEPLLTKNQATLHNQVPGELPVVNADPAQLWRIFENLITNALNHNPPGLLLTLNATIEPGLIRFTIQDNGVGMSQETCEHLFELYVRGSHARRSTGIGLGLYLCRQIITAHGGEIGAISSPGEGATFWFTLPIHSPENFRF